MADLLRVLLIDDCEKDALLLERELRREWGEIICQRIETPPAMKKALAEGTWDIVLSDQNMPNFSALAALEILNQSDLDLPFIVISGVIDMEGAVSLRLMKSGAHDFVQKDEIARLVPAISREIHEASVRCDKRLAEEEIKKNLKEKEVMLQEIHHRVKNNLQVISSLLSIQARTETSTKIKEALKKSKRRIGVMARVHEKLYSSGDLAHIDAGKYLKSIVNDLKGDFPSNVSFSVDVDDVLFGIDRAIAIGQIVNELLSNSLKYAFSDGRDGTVEVSLKRVDKNKIELMTVDDGVGLPKGFDFANAQTLGLRLVSSLVNKLGGIININRSKGTLFKIVFGEERP